MGPTVRLLGRERHLFRLCGAAGFGLAAVVALALSAQRGLSVATEAGVVVLAVGVFFALAWVTRRLTGRSSLTYYHHQAAVLGVAAAVLAAAGLPVLAHLDVTAVGLGAFLACGRLGCLGAGCCHGRPARRGVRYGAGHAVAPGLVGVRLLPVQAIESAAVALVTAAAVVVVAGDAPDGRALAVYLVGYAAIRFVLEELRGDGVRPVALGLSEAQWTSLVLVVGVLGLPAAVPAAVAGVIAARRRRLPAASVCAIAAALDGLEPGAEPRVVGGVRASTGRRGAVVHYTLSGSPDLVRDPGAVAELVARLRHPGAPARPVPRDELLHVVVEAGG